MILIVKNGLCLSEKAFNAVLGAIWDRLGLNGNVWERLGTFGLAWETIGKDWAAEGYPRMKRIPRMPGRVLSHG
jgi:hypothetical protein